MARLPTMLAVLLLAAAAFGADAREEAFGLNEAGIAALKAGNHEQAISIFTRATKLLPDAPTLRKNLAAARSSYGVRLSKEGKLGDAVEQLRLAVGLEPDIALYHVNLGTLLFREGLLDEAAKALARGVELDPGSAAGRVAYGRVLYGQGELATAIREWEAALRIDPGQSDVRGELEKARREYEAERNHTLEESPHFVISWDGTEDRSIGSRVLRILDDAYDRVGRGLGIFPERVVRVVLYSEKEFQRVTGAEDWVGGLYDGAIRVPVGNFLTSESEIERKLFHEYTHVAVRSISDHCPTWLNEGLAQHFEGKSARAARTLVLASARRNGLLDLASLSRPYSRLKDASRARLAYAQALLLTRFVLDEYGPEPIRRLLTALGEGRSDADAAESAFRRSLAEIHSAWLESL